uniref:Uncharacterized protein n=1 Tax=Cuerna arida TaxID=1464854 RepID=A0A1B6FG23_9HEMI
MEGMDILRKFNFLYSRFGCQNRSISIIKSNILFKYKSLAKDEGSDIEIGPSCCKWCLNIWSPGLCSVRLRSQKNPKRRIRALMKKDFTTLNNYQQKLVGKLKSKIPANVLVFECHICKKITEVPMRKKKTDTVPEEDDSVGFEEVKKKKKRKKKDVFAGLNAAVVQNYKNSLESAVKTKSTIHISQKVSSKKSAKKLNLKQQVRMHQVLTQSPTVQKKKPSLLENFLNSM